MQYQKLTPVLIVNDVNKNVAFYTQVLDFVLTLAVLQEGSDITTDRNDARPKSFAMLKKENVEIMFETSNSFLEEFPDGKPNLSGSTGVCDTMNLYIEVDNVSQVAEDLKSKANVVKPVHDTFYGKREISIRDCNDFIVTFAQSI